MRLLMQAADAQAYKHLLLQQTSATNQSGRGPSKQYGTPVHRHYLYYHF